MFLDEQLSLKGLIRASGKTIPGLIFRDHFYDYCLWRVVKREFSFSRFIFINSTHYFTNFASSFFFSKNFTFLFRSNNVFSAVAFRQNTKTRHYSNCFTEFSKVSYYYWWLLLSVHVTRHTYYTSKSYHTLRTKKNEKRTCRADIVKNTYRYTWRHNQSRKQ